MNQENLKPKISIGMPVYNGEQFLNKKIESILSQTYKNFELIISDNCSTDSTADICKKYAESDNRIKFIRQKKNIGLLKNMIFVLEQAKYDFFAWTAVDDITLPEFLEKNMNELLANKKIICSMSDVEFIGLEPNKFQKINKILEKIHLSFRPFKHTSITGTYEKKIRIFLKNLSWILFYGVFYTEILRKCFPEKSIVGFDGVLLLNVLEYGDIAVVDEKLFRYYTGGTQSKGLIKIAQEYNSGIIGKIFPYYPWLEYFRKKWGWKLYLKNFDLLIRVNYDGIFLIFIDILQRIKNKLG